MTRACGECQLCCRLLPVRPLHKGANQRCKHQQFKKGCSIYATPAMPTDCKVWVCRWLVSDDTADQSRPDRAHYVIDVMPDQITLRDDATDQKIDLIVVQIWIDPKHPEALADESLRAYMFRRAEQDGMPSLIRFDSKKCLTVFPPPISADGKWHQRESDATPGYRGLFHD